MNVEFVSYNGKYPNLCSGSLALIIDGELCKFGYEEKYEKFWDSGGSCGFRNNYKESFINNGDWIVNEYLLPDKFKKYSKEICEVLNSNIRQGCCGGCL